MTRDKPLARSWRRTLRSIAPVGLAIACIVNARTLVGRDGSEPISGMFSSGMTAARRAFLYEHERFLKLRPYLPARGVIGFVGPDTIGHAPYAQIYTIVQYALAPLHVLPVVRTPYRPPIYEATLQLHYDAFIVDTRSKEAVAWLAAHPEHRVTATVEPELLIVEAVQRP